MGGFWKNQRILKFWVHSPQADTVPEIPFQTQRPFSAQLSTVPHPPACPSPESTGERPATDTLGKLGKVGFARAHVYQKKANTPTGGPHHHPRPCQLPRFGSLSPGRTDGGSSPAWPGVGTQAPAYFTDIPVAPGTNWHSGCPSLGPRWLLEVNASPSLTASSQEDYELKTCLLEDTLHVVDMEAR